ncbi:uncharacterized protein LOC129777449 [Toxorhynchites rutilus septentrionalis]|uniref:uncharacterized protein LOC129777449 n=1 Tax=Toxorhynchites rutilus septentrionalis TaxID=329112 RepID=UPI0024784776|nr:uncharacterized protein LOC129777449 [Toxorhynchites rutilus septentrionalis]
MINKTNKTDQIVRVNYCELSYLSYEMVICTYFQSNNCRFGSKCNKDHIDLSTVIKSEVDATLKGNQWPLSCFGPFKENKCVPNFIEDYSFEEIRMMYLDAKMQNNIPAHQMQLLQMINEAKQKMQWLAATNREAMSVLVDLYNQQGESSAPTGQSNPFAAPAVGNATVPTTNIFGSDNASSSAFSTNQSANIFGAVPNQPVGNIFGNSAPGTSLGGNIFTKPQGTTGGTFALPSLGQQQNSSGVFAPSVFGATGASLFTQNQPQAQTGGSIFGGTVSSSSSNLFAQSSQQSIFGQSATNQNIFAAATQQPQANVSPFNPTPAPAATNLFTSTNFGNAVVAQPQQTAFSPFGAQQTPVPFGQAVPQQQSSQGLFVPTPQAVPQQQSSTLGQSNFGSSQPSTFGTNVVQQSGGALTQPAVASQSTTLYSRVEDLRKQDLDAFQADRFELGKIPIVPPPNELC